MEWDCYQVVNPGVTAPVNTLDRSSARRVFDKYMYEKPARIEMLRRLLKANGVQLKNSDSGLQDLNDWFNRNVEADPQSPGRLSSDWYSVVHDASLFLGEVIIERCPNLRWEFYTGGKKDVSFQRHVIMGFTKVPNPKYSFDIDRRVAMYGHRIVASRGSVASYGKVKVRGVEIDVDAAVARQPAQQVEHDAFWRWVQLAESQA